MQYKEGLVALNNGSTISDVTLTPIENGSLPNGTYYYVLSVIYPAGESIKSSEYSLQISGIYKGIRLSWSPVSGASGYRVYRGTTSGGQNVFFYTTNTTFDDTGQSGTSGYPKTVSNVAQYVIGYNTKFSTNVMAGCIFKRKGENVTYQIAEVVNDTTLKLSAFYSGEGTTGTEYQIVRDFTPNLELTEIWSGDSDWAYHLTEGVIRKIDKILWAYSGFQVKAVAHHNLSKGKLVNLFYEHDTLKARLAHASDGIMAHGFVTSDYMSGEIASVGLFGAANVFSNLTVGQYYLLGEYGNLSLFAPNSGIIQYVGIAVSPTMLIFNPQICIYIS